MTERFFHVVEEAARASYHYTSVTSHLKVGSPGYFLYREMESLGKGFLLMACFLFPYF